MRRTSIALLLSVSCAIGSMRTLCADDSLFVDTGEAAGWSQIAQRFDGEPEIKRDREGKVQSIEVKRFKPKPEDGTWARASFDRETGRVSEISSNGAGFTNDEFKLFTAFPHLKKLTLWHNSNFHDKQASLEDYDASGLTQLLSLAELESLTLAGGAFDDDGMRAAATLPALKYIGMWHVRVSDKGMDAFREHPTLEQIRLGPFWGKLMTDHTLEVLATCPHLKKLTIGETWLTYENGLKHLTQRKTPLEQLDLQNALIEPDDVARIRRELSETEVTWEGLAGAGKVLQSSNWHRGKAAKWMPEVLINRALTAVDEK